MKTRLNSIPTVENAYQLIAPEMDAMETRAFQSLSQVDPFVEDVVRYSFQLGGKRLRPAILFLAGKTVGTIGDAHCSTATAIEFVHTASLIHDDILDGASIRRHLATVNVRWNAQIGVLAGDWLLTKAMDLMLRDDEIHGFRRLTDACRKTCEGELRQIGTIGRFDMSLDEYFDMIAGKTAPLLACAAELGAYYADADPETVERFRLFGHKLGLAFQMIDDILDLVGETDTTGKTLRTDLLNRKPTLPLLLYLRDAETRIRSETIELLQSDDFDADRAGTIVRRLSESGAVDRARETAHALIVEAIDSIADLSGDSGAIDGLVAIAKFVGNRRN